jgi:hypothetical protein
MKIWKLLAVATLSATISACATEAGYQRILDSWKGESVDNLVMTWGPPQSSFKLSDGGQVLQYSDQRNVTLGGYTTYQPQTTYNSGNVYGYGGSANYSGTSTTYVPVTTPATNMHLSCVTRFNVTPAGKISSWSYEGNNCVAE